jgi:hypothetical protein
MNLILVSWAAVKATSDVVPEGVRSRTWLAWWLIVTETAPSPLLSGLAQPPIALPEIRREQRIAPAAMKRRGSEMYAVKRLPTHQPAF